MERLSTTASTAWVPTMDRKDAPMSAAATPPAQATTTARHHVVVIGSGFGGLTAARELAKADVDVTVIAKTTHHLFQPLLYQVATGIISEGQIAPPFRVVRRKQKNLTVVLGEVEDIDMSAKTVTSRLLERVTTTSYDSIILAAGAGQSYFGNDRFAEFAPGLKTIDDASNCADASSGRSSRPNCPTTRKNVTGC